VEGLRAIAVQHLRFLCRERCCGWCNSRVSISPLGPLVMTLEQLARLEALGNQQGPGSNPPGSDGGPSHPLLSTPLAIPRFAWLALRQSPKRGGCILRAHAAAAVPLWKALLRPAFWGRVVGPSRAPHFLRRQTLFSVVIQDSAADCSLLMCLRDVAILRAALRDPIHYGHAAFWGDWIRRSGNRGFEYLQYCPLSSEALVGERLTPLAVFSPPL